MGDSIDDAVPFVTFRTPSPSERVYRRSLELVEHVHKALEHADAARYHLKDQLDRITTDIAVGMKRAANEDKHASWRTYRKLILLVNDCATLLDVLDRKGTSPGHLEAARSCAKQLAEELMPLALRDN